MLWVDKTLQYTVYWLLLSIYDVVKSLYVVLYISIYTCTMTCFTCMGKQDNSPYRHLCAQQRNWKQSRLTVGVSKCRHGGYVTVGGTSPNNTVVLVLEVLLATTDLIAKPRGKGDLGLNQGYQKGKVLACRVHGWTKRVLGRSTDVVILGTNRVYYSPNRQPVERLKSTAVSVYPEPKVFPDPCN